MKLQKKEFLNSEIEIKQKCLLILRGIFYFISSLINLCQDSQNLNSLAKLIWWKI